jgi:hypothetical protein
MGHMLKTTNTAGIGEQRFIKSSWQNTSFGGFGTDCFELPTWVLSFYKPASQSIVSHSNYRTL